MLTSTAKLRKVFSKHAPYIERAQFERQLKMENPKFQVFKGHDGQYYFRLKAANGEIICASQGYTTKQSCLNGIAAIKSVAASAPIEELD